MGIREFLLDEAGLAGLLAGSVLGLAGGMLFGEIVGKYQATYLIELKVVRSGEQSYITSTNTKEKPYIWIDAGGGNYVYFDKYVSDKRKLEDNKTEEIKNRLKSQPNNE